MLGRGGLDIYHLSFYVCRSAGAAESKLVRVIADTACEELPSYDVLPVSTSRAVFTGRDRPSRRVTLSNLPHNFFVCFLLHVFSRKRRNSWPLATARGASLRKSCYDSPGLCVSFQSCTVSRGWIFTVSFNGISALVDRFFYCRVDNFVVGDYFCSSGDRRQLTQCVLLKGYFLPETAFSPLKKTWFCDIFKFFHLTLRDLLSAS